MPSYLIQISFKPETLAAMMKAPADRRQVVTKLAEQVGGKLVGYWFTFGDYDAVLIVEGPDNVSAATMAIAVSSTGAFTNFKTTPMLTMEEALSALEKATKIDYTPPMGKR